MITVITCISDLTNGFKAKSISANTFKGLAIDNRWAEQFYGLVSSVNSYV